MIAIKTNRRDGPDMRLRPLPKPERSMFDQSMLPQSLPPSPPRPRSRIRLTIGVATCLHRIEHREMGTAWAFPRTRGGQPAWYVPGVRKLFWRDDYCRVRVTTLFLLGAVATGITVFLLFATGFRTALLMIVTLVAGLHILALVSWVVLSERMRRLRHLINSGITTPAVFVDTKWSNDPESSWGESAWTYTYKGVSFQIRMFEHLLSDFPIQATALVDPERPARAVLLMPNGMTRGGYGLSDRWSVRRVVLLLVFTATWVLWMVAIGASLAGVSR
jgi:hypothetical protein